MGKNKTEFIYRMLFLVVDDRRDENVLRSRATLNKVPVRKRYSPRQSMIAFIHIDLFVPNLNGSFRECFAEIRSKRRCVLVYSQRLIQVFGVLWFLNSHLEYGAESRKDTGGAQANFDACLWVKVIVRDSTGANAIIMCSPFESMRESCVVQEALQRRESGAMACRAFE